MFEKGRKLELIDEAPSRLKDKEIILEIINEFINKTKIFSKLYWIEKIRYQDILFYNIEYWDGSKRHPAGMVYFDDGIGMTHFIIDNSKFIEGKKLQLFLNKNPTPSLSELFILDSLDAYVQEDYRLSIVELITAYEIVLSEFYKKYQSHYKIKNVSSFLRITSLSKKCKKSLGFLKSKTGDIDSVIIKRSFEAIHARNKILHEGFKEILPSENETAFTALSMLISRMKSII